MIAELGLDTVLVCGLLLLAWLTLTSTDLFKAIVLFISLGLLVTIAWARLGAIDIAIAEAAIGAGLTGALLLAAWHRLQVSSTVTAPQHSRDMAPIRLEHNDRRDNASRLESTALMPVLLRLLVATMVIGLAVVLVLTIVIEGEVAPGLHAAVMAHLHDSGVKNPVTAVLLNFRGYDTLLEIALLFLVAVTSLPENNQGRHFFQYSAIDTLSAGDNSAQPDPILIAFVKLLVPIIVMVSAYLLWVGAHAPGGAFQAGALLAGVGVLLSFTNRYRFSFTNYPARCLLVGGLSLFVLAAATMVFKSGVFFQYPVAYAGTIILVIELAATLSIAAALLLLYSNLASSAACHNATQASRVSVKPKPYRYRS